MRVLLDTQAAIVFSQQGIDSLSTATRKVVEDGENERLFSVVSVTEIAIKANLGKLALTRAEIAMLVSELRLTIIPYTLGHAARLFELPLHHNDPFDRMLIATALAEGVSIVSADREFKRYDGLSVLW